MWTPSRALLLLFTISSANGQTWQGGELTLLDVDKTMMSDTSGADVVDAALDAIDTACIFPTDKMFLRRYAQALTNYGMYNSTAGIWQMSAEMLTATKRLTSYTHFGAAILDQFNTDWESVAMTDLTKPFLSALAFKLYLQTLPNCSLPRSDYLQGVFLADELPPGNSATQATFHENVQDDNVCLSPVADIVVILDGSPDVGTDNFAALKLALVSFTHLASLGTSLTKMAIIQYSNNVRVEFLLNQYDDTNKMATAITGMQYLGGPGNDTGNITAALWLSSSLFSMKNGARHNDTGVTRIAIVLTQSNSDDMNGTMAAVTTLKKMGVAMFAVGIGGGVSTEYLNMIGSGCSHVAHLRSYGELLPFLPELRQLVCKQPSSVNVAYPIFGALSAGHRWYASYIVNVDSGFKLDLSTSTGVIIARLSTRVRNPNMALYQWTCRGAMNQRGLCFIPPEQLRNVTRNNETTITVYSMFSTDAKEGTLFYALASGNNRLYLNYYLVLAALVLVKLGIIKMCII